MDRSGDKRALNAAARQSGDLHLFLPEPGYRFTALRAHPPPAPTRVRRQPSALLAEAHHLVPFLGRDEELRTLLTWRDSPGDYGVALVHGSPGQGKTRLARWFADQSAAPGWLTLEAALIGDGPDPARDPRQLPAGDRGRIIVVDRAERWPVELLRRALADARVHDQRTRIVLLARPAGNWWLRITAYLRRSFDIVPVGVALAPLPPESGDRLFAAARDSFAEVLAVPGARGLSAPEWSAGPTALEVQLAALAAVYATGRHEEITTGPGAVADYLLDREYENWAGRHTGPETLARAVYLAGLAGPLRREQAASLITGIALADDGEECAFLIDDHRSCCPAEGGEALAPLHPGLLAEDFIGLRSGGRRSGTQPDPWADHKLPEIVRSLATAAPDRLVAALTTMVTVAQRWEPFAREQLGPLLRELPEVVLAAGSPVLSALAEVTTLDAATLHDLEAEMPIDGTPDLMDPLATLTRRLYERMRTAQPRDATVAALGYRLASRLVRANRHPEALAPIEHAVAWWTRPERREEPGHHLNRALSCRAEVLDGLGRIDDALDSAEAATALWWDAAGWEPDADFAAHLTLHARLLAERGHSAEAVRHQADAIMIWQASARPDHQLALARALTRQNTYCRAAGAGADAYAAIRRAAARWTKLDTEQPGVHRVELLDALTALAAAAEAPLSIRLDAGERAGKGFWLLWRRDITLLPQTAAALRAWAAALSESGAHDEAFDKVGRARNIAVRLNRQNEKRYARLLAMVQLTYGRCCLESGTRLDEGLAAARTAEEIFRTRRSMTAEAAATRLVADLSQARPGGALERPAPVTTRAARDDSGTCPRCLGSGRQKRGAFGGGKTWSVVCSGCGGSGLV
ncbi:hypothetical protein [Actinoplanes friuliensis]|uniref:Uncharacterized protein n=1 Tax=Actinoplanes friuliensis DSM 7358 TaxID=1246995 RepID=U5W2R4_9ACTN|nr:hypothetical protein [Actinoplanes friuliensis]AGZ43302.1 hypothetical protein AFR_25180 [Actinoplanes friuliensis DSM 7358]